MKLRAVTVFCGAAAGARAEYGAEARRLGAELARRGLTLVYGGGGVGLMGAVADGALAEGGRVVGVITRQLVDKELAHPDASEMIIVETMHERKMRMANLADAFVVLPGGLGTLDEMFEILAWSQLGLHRKPVGLLDVGGFYDGLMAFLDHAAREAFLRIPHRERIAISAEPGDLLRRLAEAAATGVQSAGAADAGVYPQPRGAAQRV